MIEIKHRETGEVLLTWEADTLEGADLYDCNLAYADLRDQNLSRANLSSADLRGADLTNASLVGTYLNDANLSEADLSKTDLSIAFLTRTILDGANLAGAHLGSARLDHASLRGANLYGADLFRTNLIYVDLTGAKFNNARLGFTHFSHCPTLHKADLNAISTNPSATSSLDVVTIRASIFQLPDAFLQCVGYTSDEIQALKKLDQQSLKYHSCFLSHAFSDRKFVEFLRQSLTQKGIDTYHYQYDLRPGEPLDHGLENAIKTKDKFILVCSEASLLRENVMKEIVIAEELETKQGQKKIVPIRLDDYLFSPDLMNHIERLVRYGTLKTNWVRWVREAYASDFSDWQNQEAFQTSFQKLIDALKIEDNRTR